MDANIENRERLGYEIKVVDGVTYVGITDGIKVDNRNFHQRVKVVALLKGITMSHIAAGFGCSVNNLSARLKNGKLGFDEQRRIAEILEVGIVIRFVFADGALFDGDTPGEMISGACRHADISQPQLAAMMGSSRQALRSRIINGHFTDLELEKIAGHIGCEYENYFVLEDGSRI